MVDSRKVSKGLKCCAASKCLSCPYDYRDLHCMVKLANDTLILLEEQKGTINSLYGTISKLLFSNVHEEGEL